MESDGTRFRLVRAGGHSGHRIRKTRFSSAREFSGKVAKFSEASARDVFNHGIMRERNWNNLPFSESKSVPATLQKLWFNYRHTLLLSSFAFYREMRVRILVEEECSGSRIYLFSSDGQKNIFLTVSQG